MGSPQGPWADREVERLDKFTAAGFVFAFAVIISMAPTSAAQPIFSEPYQYPGYDPWSSMDPWPGSWDGSWSPMTGYGWPYQSEDPFWTAEENPWTWGSSGVSSDGAPTATRPSGYQPSSAPSASTGSPISHLADGISLSEQEVSSLPGGWSLLAPGGSGSPVASGRPEVFQGYYGGTQAFRRYSGGLQHWIYYCGRWTYGPAALWYGQQTNTVIRNDQYQMIWSFERYPSGYEAWQYWGYWYPGYRHAWFGADAKGWHQIAVWGSRSGWSNPIWVYVW